MARSEHQLSFEFEWPCDATGLPVSVLASYQVQLISEVALAFDAALSDANSSGGPCNTATLSPAGEFPSDLGGSHD